MGTDAAFPQWLWDLLPKRRPTRSVAPPTAKPKGRYEQLVRDMKARYGIRVNRWRSSTSGCAWVVSYEDGTVSRLIESPYPRGPVSVAVFLHEVGHHAIGFDRYKPRCYEEYKAWQWALEQMRELGFNVTPRVEKRVDEALRYAVAKAVRRGIKRLPVELVDYLPEQIKNAATEAAAPSRSDSVVGQST